jgi:hypothetical protein
LQPAAIGNLLSDDTNALALEYLSVTDAPEKMQVLRRLGIVAEQYNCHN